MTFNKESYIHTPVIICPISATCKYHHIVMQWQGGSEAGKHSAPSAEQISLYHVLTAEAVLM